MIRLGAKVKDSITGLEGVATARTEYLNSVPSVCVQPCALNQGSPIPEVWIVEWRLMVIDDRGTSPGHYV